MKRKCLKKLVFFPNMIVVTVITKITLFSLTMRNKNNAIFSVFFSFSSSLYLKIILNSGLAASLGCKKPIPSFHSAQNGEALDGKVHRWRGAAKRAWKGVDSKAARAEERRQQGDDVRDVPLARWENKVPLDGRAAASARAAGRLAREAAADIGEEDSGGSST
jgi:hypothetical protein